MKTTNKDDDDDDDNDNDDNDDDDVDNNDAWKRRLRYNRGCWMVV